jgi:hypothetical protein
MLIYPAPSTFCGLERQFIAIHDTPLHTIKTEEISEVGGYI